MNNIFRRVALTLMYALLLITSPARSASNEPGLIDWQTWSPEIFEQAVRENKIVLLNLEAVWCHWCHVMDQKTYSDETVATVIRKHFIPVKVDHDARPDLAARYRDYGWPATIFLNGAGDDIVKRAGYIAPELFAKLLLAIVDDPTIEPASKRATVGDYATSSILGDDLTADLLARRYSTFDWQLGGYRSKLKNLDRDTIEYALVLGASGNKREEGMARLTIDASMALIDPAWGGAYQYSTFGDWRHPHFEKIMTVQAGFLRIYSLAYLQWKEPRYLQAALDIERYLTDFLTSTQGAYYTSQDADLVQGIKGNDFFALADDDRRQLGIPRIDKNIYTRENGWAIEAVATLYQATGNIKFLSKAIAATEWIVANRSLPGGGFRHAQTDQGGPYLGDTLNMGRAFLQLYRATGERRWLQRATSAGDFIDAHFRQPDAGFLPSALVAGLVAPLPNIDENVSTARFLNLLSHYTGDERLRNAATHAMRYLVTPEVATRRIEEGGILLAAHEFGTDPAHFTIVGPKEDPGAHKLYAIARNEAGWYKRLEWWDLSEGPLPNPDVLYPSFERAAAFVCTQGRCSVPAFDPDQYASLIARLGNSPGS